MKINLKNNNLSEKEVIDNYYIETGGVIGYIQKGYFILFMIGKNYEKKSRHISNNNPELIATLYHFYKKNQDLISGKIDPFKRIFSNTQELFDVCKEINPSFDNTNFKLWSDEGYLLVNNHDEYSYLMLSVLNKICVIGDQNLSLIEMTGLQYPIGELAILFESIFAEGIETNILNKTLTKSFTLLNVNLENINPKFMIDNSDKVFKIYPNEFGNGK
jgi:hypothetical protein